MLLQEGADVNQEGATAKTPLHRAILLGRPDYVEYLIQKNASAEVRDFQVSNKSYVLSYTLTQTFLS